MKRIAIATVAFAFITFATMGANAQSGSRSTGGGGSSSGGSSGGSSASSGASSSGGSSAGSGFGVQPSSGVGSRFRDADILNGQSNVIRSIGEANYFEALGQREYEAARKLRIENQIAIQRQRQAARDRKTLERSQRSAQTRSRLAKQRLESEMKKAERVASASSIQWPEPLQASKYEKYRTEIEQLAKLYAELDHNKGVEAGLKTSIRSLAKKIIQDEKAGLIEGDTKITVRTFVGALSKNHGQFPIEKLMKKKMMAGM